MASQVLSGISNVSYTNNTGQNVRIVINYMSSLTSMSWATASLSAPPSGFSQVNIGRNLAWGKSYSNIRSSGVLTFESMETSSYSGNNSVAIGNAIDFNRSDNPASLEYSYPTELMLAPGQTFSATCGAYNIVVIPEAG